VVNVRQKHIEQMQVLALDHMMMVAVEFVEIVAVVDDDDDDVVVDPEKMIDGYMDLELKIDGYKDLGWGIDDYEDLELEIDDCMDLEMKVDDYANHEKMDTDQEEIVSRLLFFEYLDVKKNMDT
jgi:hypothetical protein